MTSRAARPNAISALGWIRIGVRLLLMVTLLLVAIPLYYLWQLFSAHNRVPSMFLGGVAWIAGVAVRVVGERAGQGTFLLANHVSWIDIPALGGVSGAAFVAHDGIASVPVLHWLCAKNDTVFVARHDRASVARQVEQVRQALRDTGALAIFPEGTTSDGTGLLTFKSSLLSALEPVPPGIAVQPVWLDFGPDSAHIAWVGDDPGVGNFLRILARGRPVPLTIHYLAPLTGEQMANRKSMAAAASAAILAAMAGAREANSARSFERKM